MKKKREMPPKRGTRLKFKNLIKKYVISFEFNTVLNLFNAS